MEFRSAPTHLSLDLSPEQHQHQHRRIIINGTSHDSTTNPNGNTQTLDHHHHTHHHNNSHLQQLQRLNLDHHHNQNLLTSISVTGGGGEATGAQISPVSVRYEAKTPPSSRSTVRYRECLKNHAANIGGNVTDGCGEFMPSGENGTIEALTCAACNCHRNFHLKFVDGETQFRRSNSSNNNSNNAVVVHPLHLPPPPRQIQHHKFNPDHHHHHHLNTISAPPVAAVAYVSGGTSTGTGGTESSSEELNTNNNNNMFDQSNTGGEMTPHHPPLPDQHHPYSVSKKRFRTRFTQEQKHRMLEFAEKVGWRIQKQYEGELEKLCDEVGVKRQVLKVWMHNNKNHSMKKQLDQEQHATS